MNAVANFYLAAIANQRDSVGLECQAVAAREHTQGVQCLEAGGQPGDAVPPVQDIMFQGQPRRLGEVFQAGARSP